MNVLSIYGVFGIYWYCMVKKKKELMKNQNLMVQVICFVMKQIKMYDMVIYEVFGVCWYCMIKKKKDMM